jgi:hypothetical protein
MRRWETLLALLAVVLASLAALQIRGRLLFAVAAIVLLAAVGVSRIRAGVARRRPAPEFDTYERAERIREERERRLGGR